MCTTSLGLEFGHAQICPGKAAFNFHWSQDERLWYTSTLVILEDLTRRKARSQVKSSEPIQ